MKSLQTKLREHKDQSTYDVVFRKAPSAEFDIWVELDYYLADVINGPIINVLNDELGLK